MSVVHEDPTLETFNLPANFFGLLMGKYKEAIETIFERKVKPVNICHAQKWNVGGNASPHADNSELDGRPNAFETNKFVSLLYLNDDYTGGELYFPDLDIEFKPKAQSWIAFNGGIENLHGVKPIKSGTRYTFVSFWDFEEAEYDEETRQRWEDEIQGLRKQQEEEHKKMSKNER
jgi:predicted 2-oxoglutarate/Fe(II)-dependent dioxygenase YbiX